MELKTKILPYVLLINLIVKSIEKDIDLAEIFSSVSKKYEDEGYRVFFTYDSAIKASKATPYTLDEITNGVKVIFPK